MESGYSATPQLKKLGIAADKTWDIVAAPAAWTFEVAPDDDHRVTDGHVDVVVLFTRSVADLGGLWAIAERIRPNGALWIAWPRKAAGHVSDMTENAIRDEVLPRGLVDVKVAALDHDWSALKLVWRLDHR